MPSELSAPCVSLLDPFSLADSSLSLEEAGARNGFVPVGGGGYLHPLRCPLTAPQLTLGSPAFHGTVYQSATMLKKVRVVTVTSLASQG